ncbi:MAG: sigma-L-dependent transcriptional regulator [Bacillaceae bacterium]|uniref:PrpR N-terminal domain-containing protein n=1 Tax=Aeribacillus composti TaxID=1868734 RepID=A0ABY9WFS7_9BACI|nr:MULTISPECIES: sigma-54-dependent transcriptional regulator [Aeribacillus]MED0703060.1 PrpR N-terminal domain-containing protein [Aeribacillus composti]REJ19957.1 MAG: sigma-L-dependent transcriptional regulator [Bacillaceae bacterium]REJ22881.1 MAG: sigma-L-dependent transcriptional regulator [Bacillaceae bacterium]WNF32927.1 PrpR N-terminal domain-containing protein [Aeribacillus composti]
MKIKTLLIAPYPGLKELALTLGKEQQSLDITVVQGDLQEAIPIAKQYEKEGYDLIISRGGTAQLLRQHISLPVIEIKVSGYDLLRILTLVKDHNAHLHIIGFLNICQGFVSVSNLLDVKIPYTIIHDQEEVEEAVQQAKANGAQAIIGDTITCKTAEANGLQSILITSGRESIIEAFEQAKQTYQIIKNTAKQTKVYQQLLQKTKEPLVVYDENGMIQFTSSSFQKIFPALKNDSDKSTIYSYFPFLNNACTQLCKKIEPIEILYTFVTDDEHMQFRQGYLKIDNSENHQYYLRFSAEEKEDQQDYGLSVAAIQPIMTSFSQILGNSQLMKAVIKQGKKAAAHNKPVALYGEKGTGKKTLAGIIHCESEAKDSFLLLIRVLEDHREIADYLKLILVHLDIGTCVFEGVERLRLEHQNHLAHLIHQTKARIIFLFHDNPIDLLQQKKLSVQIFKQFKQNQIRLPSLKEHAEDLNEYVRKFIAQYNVKYGKQIVGVQEEALKWLYSRTWKNNLQELSSVIEQAVQFTNNEYINKEDLNNIWKNTDEHAQLGCSVIDLNKPLAEIEKDIIWKVLQEEEMNQTRAAKRLGINRSTLWRKLK